MLLLLLPAAATSGIVVTVLIVTLRPSLTGIDKASLRYLAHNN